MSLEIYTEGIMEYQSFSFLLPPSQQKIFLPPLTREILPHSRPKGNKAKLPWIESSETKPK